MTSSISFNDLVQCFQYLALFLSKLIAAKSTTWRQWKKNWCHLGKRYWSGYYMIQCIILVPGTAFIKIDIGIPFWQQGKIGITQVWERYYICQILNLGIARLIPGSHQIPFCKLDIRKSTLFSKIIILNSNNPLAVSVLKYISFVLYIFFTHPFATVEMLSKYFKL